MCETVYQGEDGCWYYDQSVRGHYRTTKNGKIWVEGHYRRALYLHPDNSDCCFGHYRNIRNCSYCPYKASCYRAKYGHSAVFNIPVSDSCFIATAAYGTPLAKELSILRNFRDRTLISIDFGRKLVNLYYRISPPIAKFIDNKQKIRFLIRAILKPVISLLSLKYK